jgi:hypothetical protein
MFFSPAPPNTQTAVAGAKSTGTRLFCRDDRASWAAIQRRSCGQQNQVPGQSGDAHRLRTRCATSRRAFKLEIFGFVLPTAQRKTRFLQRLHRSGGIL